MLNKNEWVNIRFLAKGKKIATKTFSLLSEVYGEDTRAILKAISESDARGMPRDLDGCKDRRVTADGNYFESDDFIMETGIVI